MKTLFTSMIVLMLFSILVTGAYAQDIDPISDNGAAGDVPEDWGRGGTHRNDYADESEDEGIVGPHGSVVLDGVLPEENPGSEAGDAFSLFLDTWLVLKEVLSTP